MAKRSGRNGRVYIDVSAGADGSAQPVSTLMTWSLSQATDKQDATCMGDSTKNYVAGLKDSQGSFAGLIDLGVANYNTILDGVARKLYIYPDRSNHATVYWFGTATLDGSFEAGVNDLVKANITFAAAGDGFSSNGTF